MSRQHSDEYHSVVVIGAGVAGLQAARQLLPGFPDLLVLEASHRIGGRIKQVGLRVARLTRRAMMLTGRHCLRGLFRELCRAR